jgi:hypothetical protein
MKVFIRSILLILFFILCSLADIDLTWPHDLPHPTWENSQIVSICLDYELPERYTDGADGSNVAAAMNMKWAMDHYKVDCLHITNRWVPSKENPVTRLWLQQLLKSDGGPMPYDRHWRKKYQMPERR